MSPKIPQRVPRCTTHHACPCQEYQLAQRTRALKVIKTWASFQTKCRGTTWEPDVKVLRDIATKAAEALGLGKKP